jgi:hypothetical protein
MLPVVVRPLAKNYDSGRELLQRQCAAKPARVSAKLTWVKVQEHLDPTTHSAP